MKTNSRLLVLCSFSVAVMVPGCSGEEKKPGPSPKVATLAVMADEATNTGLDNMPKWSDLKETDFAGRTRVLAGLAWIEQAADQRIADCKTQRAAMKNEPVNWEQAMGKAMSDRAYLRSMATELAAANAENWTERKGRVGRALENFNAALDKVGAAAAS